MNQKYNKGPWRVCTFLASALIALVFMRALPVIAVGDYEVKPVDFLSDLLPVDSSAAPLQTPSAVAEAALLDAKAEPCPKGVTCIEDYSAGKAHGMHWFYQVLSKRKSLGRPVRIAYFGDSFIEGDILTADLRQLLQKRFGGCGVGFVDTDSPFTKLRASVKHTAGGWVEHNVLKKEGLDMASLGVSQRYAQGGAGAFVEYGGVKDYACLDSFEVATLFLKDGGAPVAVKINNGPNRSFPMVSHGCLSTVTAKADGIRQVRFTLRGRATCYGVALEGRGGVSVDNFSLRGSSGTTLAGVAEKHLKALNEAHPYDLIVLQFGLNVANKKQKDYKGYIKQMVSVLRHFKTCFPKAAILIVSIGDREDKTNGQLTTMPGVKELLAQQQTMAAEAGLPFWNLYEAMGGEGGIRRMAEANPPEAGKDYTHINRRGGKRVAKALYKALMHGFKEK